MQQTEKKKEANKNNDHKSKELRKWLVPVPVPVLYKTEGTGINHRAEN
jgi:hypothetical protein